MRAAFFICQILCLVRSARFSRLAHRTALRLLSPINFWLTFTREPINSGSKDTAMRRSKQVNATATRSPVNLLLYQSGLPGVLVVSLAGGFRDQQVEAHLTSLHSIVPPSHSLSLLTRSVNGVGVTIDHQVCAA